MQVLIGWIIYASGFCIMTLWPLRKDTGAKIANRGVRIMEAYEARHSNDAYRRAWLKHRGYDTMVGR